MLIYYMFAGLEIYLFCTSLIVTILILWFKTDAFVEYLELLGCRKLFFISSFRAQDPLLGTNYPNFLLCQRNSFLSRLLSCPTCVSFWLSLLCCLEIGFFNLPLLYLTSLVTFRVFEYIEGKANE